MGPSKAYFELHDMNLFKESFKYYKAKNPAPTYEEVLDINNADDNPKLQRLYIKKNVNAEPLYGLTPSLEWEAYQVCDCPGLIIVKNPFTSYGHWYWSIRCTRDYTQKPNKTNLDAQKIIPNEQTWWDYSKTDKSVIDKMRWSTLGYHHNWNTKEYSENHKNDFPEDLSKMTRKVAKGLGFKKFSAEAAIVNFYHMNSTLSGHTDHSEQNLEAPLFSFSFGQTAIFLIGGTTQDVKPLPLFLRSGDILVMSKESRLCYHGVPRIIPSDTEDWSNINNPKSHLHTYCAHPDIWKPFAEYMNHSRININVRQVLKRGQLKLNEENNEHIYLN